MRSRRRRDALRRLTLSLASLGSAFKASEAVAASSTRSAGSASSIDVARPASQLSRPAWPGMPQTFADADPDRRLVFPRDFGAHPGFRTEWWYVTGWLDGRFGFQVTFFRVNTGHPEANPSRFAPRQLLFAHAALMVPARGHPLHAQRATRFVQPSTSAEPSASPQLSRPPQPSTPPKPHARVAFSVTDTDVKIGNWSLVRHGNSEKDEHYVTRIEDDAFGLDLSLSPPTVLPWLQGDAGFSRKGPLPEQASHYYSRPQLAVSGRVRGTGPDATTAGVWSDVTGTAWFDHEWSTSVLDPAATGWDWTGLNLDDGSALVAFRIRRRGADTPLWTYAARRTADGRIERIETIAFEVLRSWQSPRTQASYPVSIRLGWTEPPTNTRPDPRTDRSLTLVPLFDDQELDSRASTGTVYWEGAVTATEAGRRVGVGYLELTGYFKPMRL